MQAEDVSEHECVYVWIVYSRGYSKRLFAEVRGVDPKTIVVMEGDQTGQELLEEALRVLDPAVTGLDLEFVRYDLSLGNRRATGNEIVHESAAAMKETGFGIKAATVTPEDPSDVGSPNAILRKGIDGTVIVRTGRRIPGVNPTSGVHAPISVVRMAVDDAYGAKEWREGEGLDEGAYRTEKISRRVCRGVAEFAFIQARKMRAKVFGGPKFTVSPIYEGMLKEEMDRAPDGTAPSLEGKNVANPMAMILAGAALLTFFHEEDASRVSRAIYEATFETILDGVKTVDLGGTTLAFLGSPLLSKALTMLQLGEMVGDKLPAVPSRTRLMPLLGRAASGGMVGAAAFFSDDRRAATGVLLGSSAAVAAAFAGEGVRALA